MNKNKVRIDAMNVGDKFRYNPNDVGVFEITKKEQENWIETVRTNNNRRSGEFPWTEVYPV